MRSIDSYDYYVFDCDGVILDSNQLKIDAMQKALQQLSVGEDEICVCIDYFAKNFGKSRFHHIDQFIECFLTLPKTEEGEFKQKLLELFSEQCQQLYLSAPLTPGFIEFILQLDGKKFIASGSEQNELRAVFEQRNLAHYFTGIYGSPTPKSKWIAQIIEQMSSINTVMIGDALSDLQAALDNKIDFIGYAPYSNVLKQLTEQTQAAGFITIDAWSNLKDVS